MHTFLVASASGDIDAFGEQLIEPNRSSDCVRDGAGKDLLDHHTTPAARVTVIRRLGLAISATIASATSAASALRTPRAGASPAVISVFVIVGSTTE